jgi:NUMOD3 motif
VDTDVSSTNPPAAKTSDGSTRDFSEAGKKISRALKGRSFSEERKKKINEALRGRMLSEEHKNKLRARLSGPNNPMFGRSFSENTRAKISNAMVAHHEVRKLYIASTRDDEESTLRGGSSGSSSKTQKQKPHLCEIEVPAVALHCTRHRRARAPRFPLRRGRPAWHAVHAARSALAQALTLAPRETLQKGAQFRVQRLEISNK